MHLLERRGIEQRLEGVMSALRLFDIFEASNQGLMGPARSEMR